MNATARSALLGAALLATALPSQAEEWKHELAPYFWGAGMDGVAGVANVVADVDVSFGDILENLQFGFMGAYRGSRGPYSVAFDGIYMDLGATKRGPGGLLKGDVGLQQYAAELDFGYALSESFELFAGLRYNRLSSDVKTSGPQGQLLSASLDESWVDPVIGARYTIPFNDQWSATLRGDIGGFGVGSDFAWQGMATIRWQTSPRLGWLLAYRYIDMDYENGSGAGYFKYDMALTGPGLGVVFTF